MVRRYELNREAYRLVEDLLPRNGKCGGQRNDYRNPLNESFQILHTGAQWREPPERYGEWKSVHDRRNRWSRDGTVDRILARVHLKLRFSGVSTPPTYPPGDPRLGRTNTARMSRRITR